MKIILCLSALLAFFPFISLRAQSIQKESEETDGSTIGISADYVSNSEIYGIFNNFVTQPITSATFNYSGKKGLNLVVSGLINGNGNASSSKNSPELDFTGGWDFNLWNDALFISPSYSHFIFSSGATTLKSMYTDQAEVGLTGLFNWFKPSVAADYLFGTKNAMNFNLTLGFDLKFENVFSKGNSLQFSPSIGTNYGNLSHSLTIPKNLLQFLLPLRTTYGDSYTIQQLEANSSIAKKKAIEKQLSNINSTATLAQIFATKNNFQINSVGLALPLSYTTKNLAFNAGLNISEPMNVPGYLKSNTIFYFSAGVIYSFNL